MMLCSMNSEIFVNRFIFRLDDDLYTYTDTHTYTYIDLMLWLSLYTDQCWGEKWNVRRKSPKSYCMRASIGFLSLLLLLCWVCLLIQINSATICFKETKSFNWAHLHWWDFISLEFNCVKRLLLKTTQHGKKINKSLCSHSY